MIEGGICSYDHGSQLDEAVAFIEAHRQFVAFITIDIGANDFDCADLSCVPGGVASIQANLPTILAELRAAAGPDIPIVGMTIYNPFLGAWLTGPDGQAFAQFSTFQGIAPINQLLRGIFHAGGGSVADVESAFSTTDFHDDRAATGGGWTSRSTSPGSACGRGSARPRRWARITTRTLPGTA
jgi:hypothetical protein